MYDPSNDYEIIRDFRLLNVSFLTRVPPAFECYYIKKKTIKK